MDYEGLAEKKYNAGLYDEAIELYNKAIEIHPNESDNYYSRGLCKYQLDRYEAAFSGLLSIPKL